MKIYKTIAKKWRDAVVYECISPDFSRRCIDAVYEQDGKIFYRQVYPAWKAIPIRVLGHTGSALAERAALEIQEEVSRKRKI